MIVHNALTLKLQRASSRKYFSLFLKFTLWRTMPISVINDTDALRSSWLMQLLWQHKWLTCETGNLFGINQQDMQSQLMFYLFLLEAGYFLRDNSNIPFKIFETVNSRQFYSLVTCRLSILDALRCSNFQGCASWLGRSYISQVGPPA